jgi:hypothetical protein
MARRPERRTVFRMLTAAMAAAFVLAPAPGLAQNPTDAGEEARRLFQVGLDLFERAYDLSPRPVILYNIGMCWRAMTLFPEAIDAFRRYLAEAGTDAPEDMRAQVEQLIAEMEQGMTTASPPQPGALQPPGGPQPEAPEDVVSPPGMGEAGAEQPAPVRVPMADSGTDQPAGDEVPSGWFWATAAGAVALAAGGGIAAYFAQEQHDDFLSRYQDDPGVPAIVDEGEALQWTANGLWVAAVACAVAAGVLAIFTDFDDDEDGSEAAAMAIAAPGGAALVVSW